MTLVLKNRETKKAITNTAIFIAIGTLCVFGILARHRPTFEIASPADAEIAFEEIITEEEAKEKIKENKDDNIFYFKNIAEMDDPIDVLLFDSEMKRASKKAQEMLGRDASPEEIKDAKKIYEYMLEMKPTGERETLLELAAAAVKYSKKYSVPIGLVVGVMQTESFFNPKAISKAGAAGPMQVMWNIHNGLLKANGVNTREQLFTTDLGVASGCLILARYLRDEKSVAGGLKRYYGALSGNYISQTYANWHTYELYAAGILSGDSKNALAKDKKYLSSLMTKPAATKQTTSKKAPMTTKVDGVIQIKKKDGSTIVWRAE